MYNSVNFGKRIHPDNTIVNMQNVLFQISLPPLCSQLTVTTHFPNVWDRCVCVCVFQFSKPNTDIGVES